MIPTALLALAVGAPVAVASPAPAPPAVREVRVGFRWCYSGHVYEIVCIDETMCRYVCVSHPWVTHGGLDGATDPNWQSVGRTIREALGP